MPISEKTLFDLEIELNTKERDILARKEDALEFITSKHSSDVTQEHLTALRKKNAALARVSIAIAELKSVPEFKKRAENLQGKSWALATQAREIDEYLSRDLAEHKAAEDREKGDVLRTVTFLVVIPSATVTLANNKVGAEYIGPYPAFALGLALCSAVLFRKRLARAFIGAGRSICALPAEVANSLSLYYLRESAKEEGRMLKAAFQKTSRELVFEVGRAVETAKKTTMQGVSRLRVTSGVLKSSNNVCKNRSLG